MREVTAFVGLGSNEGDREGAIRTALQRLGATPGVRVVRHSRLLPNPAAGGPPQGEFLNGAAELRTTLPAHALLAVCKALEAAAGRPLPAPRNAPRSLDLDLLLYGDETIDTRDLVVPHPRLFERSFVVEPLRELGVELERLPRQDRPAVVQDAEAFAATCTTWLEGGCTVGFVPTMGALHRGHASLLRRARAECDRVVASIFVNPLQFGAGEDFAVYPRTLQQDLAACAAAGADAVFAPEPQQMYEPGFCSHVAVGAAAEGMEGALRLGHFAGVATVVARLFALCRPHRAYFGRKDAQQVAVVRQLVRDLGFPVHVVECAIVRDDDGLALSSRNVMLAPADRQAAPVLYRALRTAQQAFRGGERDRDALLRAAATVLAGEPRAVVDYLELRSEGELHALPPGPVAGGRMLVAARFAGGARPVRLLDNLSLDPAAEPAAEPAPGSPP